MLVTYNMRPPTARPTDAHRPRRVPVTEQPSQRQPARNHSHNKHRTEHPPGTRPSRPRASAHGQTDSGAGIRYGHVMPVNIVWNSDMCGMGVCPRPDRRTRPGPVDLPSRPMAQQPLQPLAGCANHRRTHTGLVDFHSRWRGRWRNGRRNDKRRAVTAKAAAAVGGPCQSRPTKAVP